MGVSRRSRKGKSTGRKGGWGIRLTIIALVLAIGGGGVGYGLMRSYLHSDGFRVMVSDQVSQALDVEGAFGPLRWDGLAARTTGFEAAGDGQLLAIKADDVRTEIGLGGLRDGYWLLKDSAVRRLEVEFDARTTDEFIDPELEVSPPPMPEAPDKRGWFPSELRYDTVDVTDLSARVVLDDGELDMKNHRLRLRNIGANDALDVEVRGGTILTPFEWLPELRLDEVLGRYQGESFFLTTAKFGVFGRGRLDAAGEWNGETGKYAVQGGTEGIQCSDLLDEDWSRRLTGHLTADYVVMGDGSGGPRAHGTLELHDGMLSALPLLDSLSAYADTRRFRELTLHEAHSDWEWEDGTFVLRNLRLGSEGLVRLEGTLAIDSDGEMDGSFRLGVVPGTLSRIPGAETVVFRPGEDGLLWTSLKITGNVNHPREDLTGRLIASAGARMFEILPDSGERVLRHTRTLLGDLPPDAVERALDAIGGSGDTGRKILREAGGLIEGLFGGRDRQKNNSD